MYALAGLRRWRRGTLRFHQENARIEAWLERIERLGAEHRALAIELARAQRLIKGYGDTHERGWRNFSALVARLDQLVTRDDGAQRLAQLHEAALADDAGIELGKVLTELDRVVPEPA